MTIQINATTTNEFGTSYSLTCESTTAFIGTRPDGSLYSCVHNASHQAWRGAGRYFPSLAAALEHYRSPVMRAMLQFAFNNSKLAAA